MQDTPSYNGIGSWERTVLRKTPKLKEETKETKETKISTQRPTPSTPSPRGHA